MKDNNIIKLSSLGLLPKPEIKTIKCGDAEIEVVSFIPQEDLLEMIQWSIDFIIDDRPFVSEFVKTLIADCAILKYYTNLDMSFIEDGTRMVDIYENYDIVKRFNIVEEAKKYIQKDQIDFFDICLNTTINSLMGYKNSAAGLMDNLVLNAQEDEKTFSSILKVVNNDQNITKMMDLIKTAQEIQPLEETEE